MTIINELRASQVEIPKAKGRHMFMTYTESVAFPVAANDRTYYTSFQYTVRLNNSDSLLGRVRALHHAISFDPVFYNRCVRMPVLERSVSERFVFDVSSLQSSRHG